MDFFSRFTKLELVEGLEEEITLEGFSHCHISRSSSGWRFVPRDVSLAEGLVHLYILRF